MSRTPLTEDDAKQRLVEQTDGLNRHAQIHGPAPDSASRLRKIIADHEARCSALAEAERATAGARRVGSGSKLTGP